MASPNIRNVQKYLSIYYINTSTSTSSRRHIYWISRKVSFGRNNGAVAHFCLPVQIDRPGWAYFSILAVRLRSSTIKSRRTAVSFRLNLNTKTKSSKLLMFTRRTNIPTARYFLALCGISHFAMLTLFWPAISIACQMSFWINREVMEIRELSNCMLLRIHFLLRMYSESNTRRKNYSLGLMAHSVSCRLDRFYTPLAWRALVRDHTSDPFSYSDHHMVSINVQLGHSNPQDRGVWKCNMRLLKTENFCAT